MSIPWASTAWAPAPPSTPASISTQPSTGTAPNTPSTLRRGRISAGSTKEPTDRGKKTGSTFRWKPDLEVFTDIDIPVEYYLDVMKRQAVVNAGVTFRFRNQVGGKFETTDFRYDNGILDYVTELAGENRPDPACVLADRAEGPGPGGQAGVQGEAVGLLLLLQPGVSIMEHYHNSSWLEHGGCPEKAVKSAFVSAIDA